MYTSKVFKRKINNTCKFLVLQNHVSIFEDVNNDAEEDEINKEWADKKHFLSSSLEEMVLVSLIDFECKKTIILDQELYNKFEIEMGVEPNTFIDYEFCINDDCATDHRWWQLDDPEFSMLYVFAYTDCRIFNYTDGNFYTPNECTSIICNILYALNDLNPISRRGYYLTGNFEKYNNCAIFDFNYM